MRMLAALMLFWVAGVAQAGAPDDPGRIGDVVDFAKDYWQGEDGYDDPNGWGKVVSAESQGTGPLDLGKLGPFLTDGPLTTDGRPNPDNDKGGGND